MARVMEVFVTLNAIGGILAFLGFRYAGRKLRDRIRGHREVPDAPEEKTDVSLR